MTGLQSDDDNCGGTPPFGSRGRAIETKDANSGGRASVPIGATCPRALPQTGVEEVWRRDKIAD